MDFFHEYTHLEKGRSIHAAGQMEWFNCQVDDRSKLVGGAQSIKTSEAYVIPLSIESGLVYMHSMRIPTDHDLQNYPHVFFTSPDIWDTSELDHGIPPSLLEDINQHSDDSLLQDSIFDAYGEPHHRDIQTLNRSYCDLPSLPPGEPITHVHLHDTKTSPNLRLDPSKGEDQPHDLTSDVFVYGRPNPDGSDTTPPMSIINFDDLLGSIFLLPMDENGERKRATISEHVNDLCQEQASREDQLRFKLKIDGDQLDDLMSYKQLMEYLEDKTDTGPLEEGPYRFQCIKVHKGPYTSSDPEYNGRSYNLIIEWETGEQTWETKDNKKWKEATVYDKKHITNAPKGHQKIRVYFLFDVKHCGKFKARLIADGHFTKEPMETVYPGMFLAEPNNLELWEADGEHNLQALTREKLYTVGGPECWHDKFFEILHQMGFKPSRADPDTWMKYPMDGSHYEYIAVYIDDLAIYMEDPKSFCDKLREVAPINYHLGCGYTRDEDNPTNTLSKHWKYASIWPLLKPLLFWKGDTDELNARTKGNDRIPAKKSLV